MYIFRILKIEENYMCSLPLSIKFYIFYIYNPWILNPSEKCYLHNIT